MSASIVTDRISLIPMTPGFLRACIEGDLREAQRRIQLSLPHGWPDIADVLALRLGQLEADPALQPWLLRAIALRATGEMIGHIGFHTALGASYLGAWSPDGVEFGFTIFPPHRRRGYAREASAAWDTSPSATESGSASGTARAISPSASGATGPSEPRLGSFASTTSAPPATAAAASAADRTLTSSRIHAPLLIANALIC